MSWSIGEIGALTVKAARGAGLSWGEAEEFGWAVRWLARAGLPGAEAAAACLATPGRACPVALGLSVADRGDPGALVRAGPVMRPVLVLPFLARLAEPGRAIAVTVDSAPCTVAREGAAGATGLPESGTVQTAGAVPCPAIDPPRTRIETIAPDALGLLEDLSARTYAPATEASRRLGAGGADDPSD